MLTNDLDSRMKTIITLKILIFALILIGGCAMVASLFIFIEHQCAEESDFEKTKKQAIAGFAMAQHNLGTLHEKEAFKWYKKAAEQGYANAQNQLDIIDRIEVLNKRAEEHRIAGVKWQLGVVKKWIEANPGHSDMLLAKQQVQELETQIK